MNKELLQERKKMIYDFICDELYVPMKAKEMAIVLNVPKSQRGELLEVYLIRSNKTNNRILARNTH